jgi:hypothetical protein
MIRIDENTYMDDTLVTCAEYQLFIDEMREQGKYYQPDHWTSYQFAAGLARKPILGVRFSDAKAFCEWLSKREAGEWLFRLPTSLEANQYLLSKDRRSPLGYWIREDNKAQFNWIGQFRANPRNIAHYGGAFSDYDIEIAYQLTYNRTRDSFGNHSPVDKITFERDLAIDLAINLVINLAFDQVDDRAITHELAFARESRLDRDGTSKLARELACLRELARAYYRSKPRALDIAGTLDLIVVPELTIELINTIKRTLDRTLSLPSSYTISIDQTRAHKLPHENKAPTSITINEYFDLYIDIFTLKERIAGRSPAFEGIRLVKERRKP